MTLVEKIVGDLDDKRRWRRYKARSKALGPQGHRAVEALEHYLMRVMAITKGDVSTDVLIPVLEDIVSRFERSAADGTPVPAAVGDNPVEFADTVLGTVLDARWVDRADDPTLTGIERDLHLGVARGIAAERRRLADRVRS